MNPDLHAMKHRPQAPFLALVALLSTFAQGPALAGPWQASGFKVGEVTDTTAIVWTRLTRNEERVHKPGVLPIIWYRDSKTKELLLKPKDGRKDWIVENTDNSLFNNESYFTPVPRYPEGESLATVDGAVPGMAGEARVRYRAAGSSDWHSTHWEKVDGHRDFTRHFNLTGLKPATRYELRVESRLDKNHPGATLTGSFGTAAAKTDPDNVVFTVSTGQAYIHIDDEVNGFRFYKAMEKLQPDFFVHTGDFLYYDRLAKDLPLARWHWERMFSFPNLRDFHRQVPIYYTKDDHDTWMDDCYPKMKSHFMGTFTFDHGLMLWREQLPMSPKPYRTFRWGKDFQIWIMEGREFRSSNPHPDGPNKTIWGREQMAWFERTVRESDATFKVIVSPSPIVGPDRDNKFDNHSNPNWKFEGDRVRRFIASQKNTYVVCGDRHWQYVSVDTETGVKEFSCGPASDAHAGGWTNDMLRAEHRYLNVTGGFLAGFVERKRNEPRLIFRHYSVEGEMLNEVTLKAE